MNDQESAIMVVEYLSQLFPWGPLHLANEWKSKKTPWIIKFNSSFS